MDEILLDNFKMAMKYLCGENWTIKQNPETKKYIISGTLQDTTGVEVFAVNANSQKEAIQQTIQYVRNNAYTLTRTRFNFYLLGGRDFNMIKGKI